MMSISAPYSRIKGLKELTILLTNNMGVFQDIKDLFHDNEFEMENRAKDGYDFRYHFTKGNITFSVIRGNYSYTSKEQLDFEIAILHRGRAKYELENPNVKTNGMIILPNITFPEMQALIKKYENISVPDFLQDPDFE